MSYLMIVTKSHSCYYTIGQDLIKLPLIFSYQLISTNLNQLSILEN